LDRPRNWAKIGCGQNVTVMGLAVALKMVKLWKNKTCSVGGLYLAVFEQQT
jgi:hypothetical protein